MAIKSVAVNASSTEIFLSNGDKLVSTMIFCNSSLPNLNQDDADLTYLTIHLVKNGDPVSVTNMIVNALPVPAGETVFFDTERIVLENGDKIVAVTTSPAVIVCTISTADI